MTKATPRYYDTPVNVLARQVAHKFGGMIKLNLDGEYMERCADVILPARGDIPKAELSLDLRGYGVKPGMVTVSIRALPNNPDVSRHGLKFASASMNSTRGAEAVLSDIARRVVDDAESNAALIEYAKRGQRLADDLASVKAHLAAIVKRADKIRVHPHNTPTYCGAYFSGPGFDGKVTSSGYVEFRSFNSVPMERALAIMALLAEAKADA